MCRFVDIDPIYFFHLLLGRKEQYSSLFYVTFERWGLYCNIWDSIVGGKDFF